MGYSVNIFAGYFLLSGFLLSSANGFSQDVVTLSGKVQDRETKAPLSYASVNVKGKYFGTITNEQGDFDLHVSKANLSDTLSVSYLGYENFEHSIGELSGKVTLHIELTPHPLILNEVVVTEGLNAKEKLKTAFERIPENYPSKPFLLEGFYREIKKANGKYVSLIEAAVDLYDQEAYRKPKIKNQHRLQEIDEKGVIREIRQSFNFLKEEVEAQIGLHNNLLAYLLVGNPVKYPVRIPASDSLDETAVYLDHKIVYDIRYRSGESEVKYILDSDSYGILEIIEHRPGQYHHRKISDSVSLNYIDLEKSIKFRSVNGLLYPHHLKLSWRVEKVNDVLKKTELSLENSLELLINNIRIENITPPKAKDKMAIYSLAWQAGPYHPEFWKTYNLIKETPINRKIVQDLEKELSLEKQFSKSN